MMTPFSIIVAVDKDNGIGKDGILPWQLPPDLKHFKEITCRNDHGQMNVVVMGRKTWESIPLEYRPLKGRVNVVLTRSDEYVLPEGVLRANGLTAALQKIEQKEISGQKGSVFVIGGKQVFVEALKLPLCERLYVTHILNSFDCDTFFPPIGDNFHISSEGEVQAFKDIKYFFSEYNR